MQEKSSIQVKIGNFLSVIFHPVFVPAMVFAFLAFYSPNVFFGFPEKTKMWWLITISYITITFPLLTVFLLWRLKFIDNMHMRTIRERYAALMASMLFYFWVFWLFHHQFEAPVVIQTLLLGSFLSTVLVFMFTIFFKISMHTAAWGSVVSFAIICSLLYVDHSLILLISSILIAGVIGSVRLFLNEHIKAQLWMGYSVGAIAMPLAYFIVKLLS